MITDSFNFSMQLFLALGVPALIAVLVVGLLGGFIENLLGLKGSGLKYGLKFVMVIGLVYLFSGTAISQIQGQLHYLLSK
jgi:type III secretory pathway component EscS